MEASVAGGYAAIDTLRMYYETSGRGPPLLLLHGGFLTIEQSFGPLRPTLDRYRRTIAPEQQAHGRTADVDRPLTYEQMVEDTAALLSGLGVTGADVFGWSDGGVVALGLALRHPHLVRRVAIMGAGYGPDAETPAFRDEMAKLQADNAQMEPLRAGYAAVAPRPENWRVLVEKIKKMYLKFAGWPAAEVCALKAPLLVMLGDRDLLRLEHAIELFRMVPNGRLAVLPGADHSAPVKRPAWVLAMLEEFYSAELD